MYEKIKKVEMISVLDLTRREVMILLDVGSALNLIFKRGSKGSNGSALVLDSARRNLTPTDTVRAYTCRQ